MERVIQVNQKLCKGLTLNEEFTLDLNDEQIDTLRAVAIQCDWVMGDVFSYLVEHENRQLLIQLFEGDLEDLKEKLIEGIYDINFDF
ncbi:hypothetical protein NE172_15150 [Clostridium botulinum]|uniref:Uncharacterized protein n=1 Tax=Clostridium botulinum TaxID=1491 RepID=A0A6B4JK09_CLOBO|nr:hypothetical protein [Clostridium botulinum]EES48590.1 hypothetical protein CLO_0917 [Clostridium botulinum E1 str. 'BoNT E Beluga']MBY6760092.1 hypothetical protein [Clostridium botulinum]MBY6919001.1 hypothetical protein [Clostridium botulinum]MCR1132274.1 hypothetical protein [Clostridium botulinum]NFJ57354.1 hypothetical protein [Clostridium botulinum]